MHKRTIKTGPSNRYRLPVIEGRQVSNDRYSGIGKFLIPDKFLFYTLYAMPGKLLKDHKQVIKTYSRLITHPYPKLAFDDYKSKVLEYATELELARNAPNKIENLSELDKEDMAMMSRVVAVNVAKDTTFFLDVVHLTLLKFIYGEFGKARDAYECAEDKWSKLPYSVAKLNVVMTHSEDGGIVLPDDCVDIDDGFSIMTENPTEQEDEERSNSSGSVFGSVPNEISVVHRDSPLKDDNDRHDIQIPDNVYLTDDIITMVRKESIAIWQQTRVLECLDTDSNPDGVATIETKQRDEVSSRNDDHDIPYKKVRME